MEINEKLDIFYRAAIDAANGQSEAILQEYKEGYESALSEYRREKEAQQQTRERIAQEGVRKNVNRTISEEIVRLKKEYHERQEEKKEQLFALVEKKLADYRATEEYTALLKRKLGEAISLAGGAKVRLYIDPADIAKKQELEQALSCEILVSAYSFGGGMRAVIPEKHILMDESFDSKLLAERERFSF